MLTVGLLLFSGYSDRINPEGHEWIACAGMALPLFIAGNVVFTVLWAFIAWRRLWIPLLGFALAYVPIRIYMPLHPQQTVPDDAMTIVSWNVCGYGGNYKYKDAFDSVFAYALRNNADIVCLQESMGDRFKLKKCMDYYPYNDTTRISSQTYPMLNCVGISSRYPILRKEVIGYESPTNGSVAYYLQVGSDTVIVINNHLESTHLSLDDRKRYKDMLKGDMPNDTVRAETRTLVGKLGRSMAKRAPQAIAIHRYVEQHRQYPIIVCGDFNDTPISFTRHTIAQGLTDCYVETGNGIGISYNQKGFNFRIDHVLVSDHFTPYSCKIDHLNDVSDHYPVVCKLKMKDK